ncbi:MAG TPA: NAD-dependent epimerase/dehydratase family protein [Candidatus Limnocylindria bacterium]|jgi:nucleoside-diphosphate-sugar epimerase|nr:NAD-dependent epimerase/dehydratase family protein [Candidatus Limnocylindria bacterium]
MKVFVTGATGFVTGTVTMQLLARGDEVRALVRDASRAQTLARAGVALVAGDLSDNAALRRGMEGIDAVVHGAAMYSVGIPPSRRPAMFEANVTGTERVLDAARAAGVRRVAYVSTCGIFGNTRGQIVDETYTRTGPFTSYYEETKVRAHEIALRATERDLDVSIAQPGAVYGQGDTSGLGGLMRDFVRGRLPLLPFGDAGLNFVHVDDVARGIVLVLDRGQPGRAYVLGGENARVADAFAALARITGRAMPRLRLPYGLLELGALVRPGLREVVTSTKGVTFWATDARAKSELHYSSRDLEAGLRDTYGSAAA